MPVISRLVSIILRIAEIGFAAVKPPPNTLPSLSLTNS